MSWEEEYRSKRDEVEEIADSHIGSLQAKIEKLQKELRRRHRKTVFVSWLAVIAVVTFEVWYYSRH